MAPSRQTSQKRGAWAGLRAFAFASNNEIFIRWMYMHYAHRHAHFVLMFDSSWLFLLMDTKPDLEWPVKTKNKGERERQGRKKPDGGSLRRNRTQLIILAPLCSQMCSMSSTLCPSVDKKQQKQQQPEQPSTPRCESTLLRMAPYPRSALVPILPSGVGPVVWCNLWSGLQKPKKPRNRIQTILNTCFPLCSAWDTLSLILQCE